MALNDFDEQFQVAAKETGPAYAHARDRIVALGAGALPAIRAKRHADDWRSQLTADILAGWIGGKARFDLATAYES